MATFIRIITFLWALVKMLQWVIGHMASRCMLSLRHVQEHTHTKTNQSFRWKSWVCATQPKFEFSRLKTDYSSVDYTPFVTACYFEMTFSPVLWTDVLMMHEMCRLAVLVLFQCSVPASKLVIGAPMSYLWDSSCLFKERGPFILFTWEQVSKCQFQWFIFHVRIEMSQPSIILARIKCQERNIF